MWQIMWLFSLIPLSVLNWLINLMLIAGLTGLFAGWLGKYIPFYGKYATTLKPIGIALLCVGLFLKGGYANEEAWRAKIADLEEQVKLSEQQAKDTNIALEQKSKEKVKVVKEVQVVIQERIKEVTKKIDADCKVDPEAISILNDAANNVKGTKK